VGTAILVTNPPDQLPPAFYAAPSAVTRRSMRDWWIVLHPPYTLWHLSYVVIGACLAPHVDGERMAATLVAFFLAVGVGAHALDELHGRPLRTSIPGWALTVAAVASLASAVGLGLVGVARVGPGLAVFIVVGVVLALGYNLELLGGCETGAVSTSTAVCCSPPSRLPCGRWRGAWWRWPPPWPQLG